MSFIIISMNLFIIPMNFIIISMNFIIISLNIIEYQWILSLYQWIYSLCQWILSLYQWIWSLYQLIWTHTQAFQRLRAAHSLSSQQHIWLTSTVYRSSIDFHWRNCIYVAHVWFGLNVFFNSLLVWEYLCLFFGSYENIYVFCR